MATRRKYGRINTVVLFADLVGSSEVGNSLGAKGYWDDYVSNFYAAVSIARRIAISQKEPSCRIRLAGDECIIFYRGNPNRRSLTRRAHEVLRFTYILKALWFVSPFNVARMEDHKAPREIAVGAHCGVVLEVEDHYGVIRDVTEQNHAKKKTGGEPWFVGHTINVAKRIESVSRDQRHLNMCVSAPIGRMVRERAKAKRKNGEYDTENIIYGLLHAAEPEYRDMKGIDPTVRVNELLPSWESGRKEKGHAGQVEKDHALRVEAAIKLIKDIYSENEAGLKHVTDGAELISNFYKQADQLSERPIRVQDAVKPLLDYGKIYAQDSWSIMLAGLSLLSISKIKGIERSSAARDTGRRLLARLLREMKPPPDRIAGRS